MYPSEDLLYEVAASSRNHATMPVHFVEKDWFVTELLHHVSTFDVGKGRKLVFTGGTSLSKGRNALNRFSEDVDFLLVSPTGQGLNRTTRRKFRNAFLEHIVTGSPFDIALSDKGNQKVKSSNEGKSVSIELRYPRLISEPNSSVLRPVILMDLVFKEGNVSAEQLPIRSIVDELTQTDPRFTIACRNILAIAGDKLSALTWRTLAEQQGFGQEKDYHTIIRHLHDLAVLAPLLHKGFDAFAQEVSRAMITDLNENRGQGTLDTTETAPSSLYKDLLRFLQDDPRYKKRYDLYVQSMSYALPSEQLLFDAAFNQLKKLIERLTNISR